VIRRHATTLSTPGAFGWPWKTPDVTSPPPGFAEPGNCHRIALAVHDVQGAMEQWKTVFGAGVMFDHVHDELDGSDMGMVWMGDVPVLALGSADPDGLVGRWLAKNGPGVQSLAWEVPDMWAAQNYLQHMGVGITGVHVPGRHFFMHPRDTSGLMLELTDDRLPGDRRQGLEPTGGGDGLVQVHGVAHVTAVVPALEPVTTLFAQVFGAAPRPIAATGSETVADFDIGDLTVRVVEPHDDSSEGHDAIANDRGTLHSVSLVVDLDAAPAALEEAGIGITDERDDALRLDPADTFGILLELIDAA
jgi:methylmalonyl-CoA/ethylmalonyl-CoA epimerase